jgi:hypothetical protein
VTKKSVKPGKTVHIEVNLKFMSEYKDKEKIIL